MSKGKWSKVLRGVAQAAEGLAELLGNDEAPLAGVDSSTLASILSGFARANPGVDFAPLAGKASDLPSSSAGESAESISPLAEQEESGCDSPGEFTQDCPELRYQERDQKRRQVLAKDPVNAMSVAAYWIRHLVSQPLRSEEWTRSVEAIPVSAQDRYEAVMYAGTSDVQLYATHYDEAMRDLKEAEGVALKLREEQTGIDTDDLLDADRITRINFWLGDRPPVMGEIDVSPAEDIEPQRLDAEEHLPGDLEKEAAGLGVHEPT